MIKKVTVDCTGFTIIFNSSKCLAWGSRVKFVVDSQEYIFRIRSVTAISSYGKLEYEVTYCDTKEIPDNFDIRSFFSANILI